MARAGSRIRVYVLYWGPVGNNIPVYPLSSVLKVHHWHCHLRNLEPWPESHQDRVLFMGPFSIRALSFLLWFNFGLTWQTFLSRKYRCVGHIAVYQRHVVAKRGTIMVNPKLLFLTPGWIITALKKSLQWGWESVFLTSTYWFCFKMVCGTYFEKHYHKLK